MRSAAVTVLAVESFAPVGDSVAETLKELAANAAARNTDKIVLLRFIIG
jgi:hypothetical protein